MSTVLFMKKTPAPMGEAARPIPDVSVVLPALNEAGNVKLLVPGLKEVFHSLRLSYEIIVVDGGSRDKTRDEAESAGALCILQKRPGYGGALREGFQRARGDYVLTLDCDMSHPPGVFHALWAERTKAELVIASRFITGGESAASPVRKYLSVILNLLFSKLLLIPVKDLSSGYRLYRRRVLKPHVYRPENFNILQEIAVRAFCDGFSIKEVPLDYQKRLEGSSHASISKFAFHYLRSLYRLWVLRNLTTSADYEDHAFDSRHFLQRYWQRARTALVKTFLNPQLPFLDIGCGSSKITQLNSQAVAIDLSLPKLRFLKRTNERRIQADAQALPLRSASFRQVVLSQLLPCVTDAQVVLREINRVLEPGGKVVISVPDSGRTAWKLIGLLYHRLLPNVGGQDSLSHFTRYQLCDLLAEHGFRTVKYRYIAGAELVLCAEKVEELQ